MSRTTGSVKVVWKVSPLLISSYRGWKKKLIFSQHIRVSVRVNREYISVRVCYRIQKSKNAGNSIQKYFTFSVKCRSKKWKKDGYTTQGDAVLTGAHRKKRSSPPLP